jgi:hypothetical protein
VNHRALNTIIKYAATEETDHGRVVSVVQAIKRIGLTEDQCVIVMEQSLRTLGVRDTITREYKPKFEKPHDGREGR